MTLSDVLEKLGRTIFERPFTGRGLAENAPELEEIRLAVIDVAKARSHRAGRVRVFSYDLIRIHVRGVAAEQAGALESAFLAEFLAKDLQSALARSSFRFPDHLRVELRTMPELPGDGEEFIWVETEMERLASSAAADAQPGVAWLTVIHGDPNLREIELTRARTNIGRNVEVYRTEGPPRRNDVAFVEDTEVNRTVSREHAHVAFNGKTRKYRIFNDRWYKAGVSPANECGLWIVRGSTSLPVHRGQRGVVLQAGDEIHLGKSVVRFEMRKPAGVNLVSVDPPGQ